MDDTPKKNTAGQDGASLFGDATNGYRVLARKYRPRNFDDLIGQEAMVRTLSNAFASGRIAQAYLLTGVRGVGKTTTARILARALNYEPKSGKDTGPTLEMPELGKHCQEILESRELVEFLGPDAGDYAQAAEDGPSHQGKDDDPEWRGKTQRSEPAGGQQHAGPDDDATHDRSKNIGGEKF